MKIKELKKEIKGVFKQPVKKYYFGKIRFGTPYFFPRNFEKWIFSFRILREKSPEDREQYAIKYPHLKNQEVNKFSNLPMVRRNRYTIFKLFGKYIFLSIGYPITIKRVQLGWKWKYDDVRYEWSPSFNIYFFNWQFCVFHKSPDRDDDRYYEMILHYLYSADKDIEKAEEIWNWTDMHLGESTWNKNYLI